MATLQIREALRRAMTEEMRRDDRGFLIGEEVAHYNGAYKVSQECWRSLGRIIVDTPIAEGLLDSASVPPWLGCAPSSSL